MRGTINNYVKWSSNFGGVRKCFEGHTIVAVGGFSIDLDDMPTYGNALAAGTPVYADEQARTIVPLYTFKVISVDGSSATKTITVEKHENGTTAKVGMKLGVVGANLGTAVSNVATVTAIDSSNAGYDVLSVDAVASGGTAFIAANDILAEFNGTTKKVKVVPNGLTYRDNVLDPDATAMDVDYIWNCMEKPVLERRMPPLTDSLKAALLANGCFFRFSNRK